jgi:2Fe-2S ferredoxin
MGRTVLDVALRRRVEILHSCGGMGSCGTCRIYVESDLKDLPPRSEIEEEMASDRGFSEDERLACQTHCYLGLRIRIPDYS